MQIIAILLLIHGYPRSSFRIIPGFYCVPVGSGATSEVVACSEEVRLAFDAHDAWRDERNGRLEHLCTWVINRIEWIERMISTILWSVFHEKIIDHDSSP